MINEINYISINELASRILDNPLLSDVNIEQIIRHILDADFPFEDSLVPQMCDNIYNVLTNSIYRPKDDNNDANDALANLANYLRNNMKSDFQKQIDG